MNTTSCFNVHTTAGIRQITVQFSVPATSAVSLRLFSLAGRQIATLLDKNQCAGTHSLSFDLTRIPAGTCFARLTIGEPAILSGSAFSGERKMVDFLGRVKLPTRQLTNHQNH